MTPELLYNDPDLASFYDLANCWAADFDFCARLAANAACVLDLGCGTGELAASLSANHEVYGVDPAVAMLAHARARPGGDRVTWVEGDARTLTLDRQFDLIVLTGHAFQVFLTDADQLAVLRAIARHLTPNGRFVFDMRNAARRAWETWEDRVEIPIDHPRFGQGFQATTIDHDPATNIVAYTHHYRLPDGETRIATSRIRFDTRDHLISQLTRAGLTAHTWYGDWTGTPGTRHAAEIIPLGGLV